MGTSFAKLIHCLSLDFLSQHCGHRMISFRNNNKRLIPSQGLTVTCDFAIQHKNGKM